MLDRENVQEIANKKSLQKQIITKTKLNCEKKRSQRGVLGLFRLFFFLNLNFILFLLYFTILLFYFATVSKLF